MDDLLSLKEVIIRAVEIVGVLVMLVGGGLATARFVAAWWTRTFDDAYRGYRRNLGRAILLGLEFFVAADIINTVAVSPTFQDVTVLAGIVLIRTLLSFSLEIEISGRWPWRRAESRHSEEGLLTP